MRPRYVAMSYEVPPEVVLDILGLERPDGLGSRKPPTMAEVAAAQGVTLDALTERLRAGVAAYQPGAAR
ncbi:hypothetical protein [Tropicimonas sp. IMCC6043]|uniref:hypothetical protein n=1 Tax=Tropicimonas sp. IMCC6043 TaxID=2510645 RepID=UPI00101DAB0F|nr:hypothetical protein [Tropicimonas sp. IMCC6043]RYH09899.1 hypothetical protein EU800_10110 [Tropicimonas sp. IMCC6043]